MLLVDWKRRTSASRRRPMAACIRLRLSATCCPHDATCALGIAGGNGVDDLAVLVDGHAQAAAVVERAHAEQEAVP